MAMQKHKYLRCFAEAEGGVWVAYCVDLALGAQGDSFQEAKGKLEAQIRELAEEISEVGHDHALVQQLLNRKPPLSLWLRYWLVWLVVRAYRLLGRAGTPDRKRFREPLPAELVTC